MEKLIDRESELETLQSEYARNGSHSALLEKNGVYAAMWADYQRSAQWKVGKEATV